MRHGITMTVATLGAMFATAVTAQEPPTDRPWAFISANPDEPGDRTPAAPIRNVLLRPNVDMTFHVFVHNPTDKPQEITVVIASGPSDADKLADAAVRVPARSTIRVAAPKAAPGTPPEKSPPTASIGSALYLRVLDRAGDVLDRSPPLAVRVLIPSDYVDASAEFKSDPDPLKNRLTVRIFDRTPLKKFAGGPAKVRLSLTTDRIPNLIPESAEDGTFVAELPAGGDAVLVANNLRFRDTDREGIFTVAVDSYERAFLFKTDFRGTTPSQTAVPPGLRLVAQQFAEPGKPFPVRLEVDKPPANSSVVEFGADRAGTGEFVTKRYPTGEREEAIGIRWGGADGGLIFAAKVSDRVENLETAGVFGPRRLRLRLLDKNFDEVKPPAPVFTDVVFDKTAPNITSFSVSSKEVIRGKPVTVQATAVDPESGVKSVLFFLGEPPLPDGKLAPNSRVIPATPPKEPGGPYTATVTLPDAKRLNIGVRVTNPLGMFADKVEELEPADPPEPKKFGAIKGMVVQGPDERPQKKLTVRLLDPKGVELKVKVTDDKGEFAFEDLLPGKYFVTSAVPSDRTTAYKEVTVEIGKTEEVKLALKR